jgi:gamma-glutamylputrescine oxidase
MKHLLSYWERSVLLRPFDFAILGAGLIGKQAAIRIKTKYPGARVALVDRSPVTYGASTRNAGFACFGSVSEILDDFTRSPQDEVLNLLEKRYRGINELVGSFGAEAIGYRPTGSHEVFTERTELEKAREHLDGINILLRDKLGINEVFSLRKDNAFGMNIEPGLIFNPHEGALNSGMLNEVISEKAHKLGIIPLYGLDIKSISKAQNAYIMEAANGLELTCNQLLIANNAFAAPFLPAEDIQPARGQIIITKPLAGLPFDGIFHSDKGYVYFRNIDERILIGGGRNRFLEQENTYDFEGSSELLQYLKDYLANVVIPGRPFEIDMHWSGIMAMGAEKIPIVTRVDDNLLLCVRMSGMGVALGPVLSREIADLV